MKLRAAAGWSSNADPRGGTVQPDLPDGADASEQPSSSGRLPQRSSLRGLVWLWGGILGLGLLGAVALQLLGPPTPGGRVAEVAQPPAPNPPLDVLANPSERTASADGTSASETGSASPEAAESTSVQDARASAPPADADSSGTPKQTIPGSSPGAAPAPEPKLPSIAEGRASSLDPAAGIPAAEPSRFAAPPPTPEGEQQLPIATASANTALAAPPRPAEALPATPLAAQPAAPDAAGEPEMIRLPGGTFRMGSSEDRSERPIRSVTVAPVAMSKYAVTVREWQRCVEAKACTLIPKGKPDQPVTNVSWDDANGYAAWLSSVTGHRYRLPTEAEWEFAARAGAETRYSWGNAIVASRISCKGCGTLVDPQEPPQVSAYPPNAFGLYGMGGGAAEWVADCWHRDYQGAPRDGNTPWDAPNCRKRVLRGGSWRDDPDGVRVSSRDSYDAPVRYPTHGFRLVQP